MRYLTIAVVLLFLLFRLTVSAHAAAEAEWMDDYEAARAKAAKDGKDLLLDFTGSDWCVWCKKLKAEVFGQEAFKADAAKHFVLVELDYPRQKKLPEKLTQQNEKLSKDFGIAAFPTVFLTDAKGRAYAKAGYEAGGAEKYVAMLATLRAKKVARDEAFGKAEKASGLERAKLLDQALDALEKDEVLAGYDDIIKQIVGLDSDNKAGLKAKYETRERLTEIAVGATDGNVDGALAKVEAFIKENAPTGEPKQHTYLLKAMLLHNKQDKAGALAALQTARDAAPGTELAKRLGKVIENLQAETRPAKEPEKKAPEKK